jgi:hypothetical protein
MADRDSDEEPLDTLTIGEDFVQSPEHKAPQTGSIDFDGLLQPGLKLHQDLANGNGGQAWPAGMVLTKYLLRIKRDELKESSMSVGEHLSVAPAYTSRATQLTVASRMELGAGSGLVGSESPLPPQRSPRRSAV